MSWAPRRVREGPAPIGVETQVTSLEGQLFAIRAFGVPIRSYFPGERGFCSTDTPEATEWERSTPRFGPCGSTSQRP